MTAGRVLGLDLGQARIGVAISEPAGRMAVPMGTVRTGAPNDLRAIAEMVRVHGVTEIVVGLPLRLSGESGVVDQTAAAVILQAYLDRRR